jgi:hypothetical protein
MKESFTMVKLMQGIYFYIPSQELIDSIPDTPEKYWKWINDVIKDSPIPRANGGFYSFHGPYGWTVLTFLHLRSIGFTCELMATLPTEGIVITHGDFLSRFLKALPDQFIVEIKPDRSLQCIFANFVITQNKHDPVHHGLQRFFIKSAFVTYWPQPGLIPRDLSRGDRFENVCYMGNPNQFLREIDILELEVSKLGLNWKMARRERWHDYSEVDAVVAVRSASNLKLNRNPATRFLKMWLGFIPAHLTTDRKPASKLYNAWLAGTPAILSPDIAYEDIRKSELDYLEANNIQDIIERLRQLKNNPALRRAMIDNGKTRAKDFNSEKIARDWIEIIQTQIIPSYAKWKNSPFYRSMFFFWRTIAYEASYKASIPLRFLLNHVKAMLSI